MRKGSRTQRVYLVNHESHLREMSELVTGGHETSMVRVDASSLVNAIESIAAAKSTSAVPAVEYGSWRVAG